MENEELKKFEEALPRLKECDLEKASRLYKAKTGVERDGFHPKVPLDMTKATRGAIVEFLEKVEQSGKWPQACTTIFFLIPKNVTSERPIVLMPTLIRWWEASGAPEVAKWQNQAGEKDQGAVALVMDLAKAFERVSLLVAWATHFSIQRKILRVLCGYFEQDAQRSRSRPSRPSCQGPSGVVFVLQGALSEVTKIYPPLKLRVFVYDSTAPLMGNNKEVAVIAKKVMKKLKEEVEKKGLKLSVPEKSKMIVSCGFLEDELRQCSKEGVTMADSVETLGVDLRTRVKNLGAKEKTRRKKCNVRFWLTKKNKALQKSYMKFKLRRQMAAAASKKSTTSLSLFMEAFGLEVEEELSTMATQTWAEGVWMGKWNTEQKETCRKQNIDVQLWRQVKGPAEAVMCETRDLGIKWPQWHALICEGEVRTDTRYVCPKDVESMLLQQARSVCTSTKNCRKVLGLSQLLMDCEGEQRRSGRTSNVARTSFLDGG